MTTLPDSANIDLHLVKVLFTVITERSVSRAALRLGSTQPLVSAQLRRLRSLTGDALLVRGRSGMVPTEAALALLEPAERLLREADLIFGAARSGRDFEPSAAELTVRIAASDYLAPEFLPALVTRLRSEAPLLRLELLPLSAEFDYRRKLAQGEVDLVIGNWLEPPDELHLGRLVSDEVVCLVSADHPAVRDPARWDAARYLGCEHIAPTPLHPGARGVIDDHLASLGLDRRIAVRCGHFSLVAPMVASSRLVLTTGRLWCRAQLRTTQRPPLVIVPCPLPFPPMAYYQLWHDRTHAAASLRWVRETVRDVARALVPPLAGPARAALA
jgi:DNA-binding transcriptional LysR family regulator